MSYLTCCSTYGKFQLSEDSQKKDSIFQFTYCPFCGCALQGFLPKGDDKEQEFEVSANLKVSATPIVRGNKPNMPIGAGIFIESTPYDYNYTNDSTNSLYVSDLEAEKFLNMVACAVRNVKLIKKKIEERRRGKTL